MRSLIIAVLVGGLIVAAAQPGGQDKKRLPKFTIGKDTTFVTGPVDKDGYIDYVAALNERQRKGVTPDNNANVLLWKAFGPKTQKVPAAEFFRLLGIDVPPEQGEYLVELGEYIQNHLKTKLKSREDELYALLDQLDLARERAWKADKYPKIAGWLKVNDKPLDLIVAATKRPRYYSPLVSISKDKNISEVNLVFRPGTQLRRASALALTARAMQRTADGSYDEAWQDILACHRLAHLLASTGYFEDYLLWASIEGMASGAAIGYLDGAKLDARQTTTCLGDLQEIWRTPAVADNVVSDFRFWFLDGVMQVERRGMAYLEDHVGDLAAKSLAASMKQLPDAIDWDQALRIGNRFYDNMIAAMHIKQRSERENAINHPIAEVGESIADNGRFIKALANPGSSPLERGTAIGKLVLLTLTPKVLYYLQRTADMAEQTRCNALVAFALCAVQREHGKYPAKLEELAPKLLARIPSDLFSGKPLVYRPSADGFLLYSLGVNGTDDQGRGHGDDPPGDDLSVRMPLPTVAEK